MVRTTIGVSKIDQLKVLVIPFFPPTLLVFDEQMLLKLYCKELQPVVFPWLENMVVLVVKPSHK
jgi:hypothetical protein